MTQVTTDAVSANMPTTAKAIIESNYAPFASLEPEDKKRQISALHYIEHLSASTGKPIDSVNIFEVFGQKTNKDKIVIERNELNTRFFSLKIEPPKMPSREDDFAENIKIADKHFGAKAITNLEQREQEQVRYFDSINNDLTNQMASLAEARQELARLRDGVEVDFLKEIKEVIKDGFFVFDRIAADGYSIPTFVFKTTRDCVLVHKNAKTGVNVTANFGQFEIHVVNYRNKIYVKKYKNNFSMRDGYYHPHLNGNGVVCWGNASGAAAAALGSGNLTKLMELIRGILFVYNPGNPYVPLEVFHEMQTKNNKDGSQNRCSECHELSTECCCNFCSECGAIDCENHCPDCGTNTDDGCDCHI